MHSSVMAWGIRQLTRVPIQGLDVVEVGARNYNGSLRESVLNYRPASYLGTDMEPGDGVDRVIRAECLPEGIADLVICTEMLEHADNWRMALGGMVGALRPWGWLLLTTRSPDYPKHMAPDDHWRFPVPLMANVLINGLNLELHALEADGDAPGVFALARKINNSLFYPDNCYVAVQV